MGRQRHQDRDLKFLDVNENKNTVCQNIWYLMKSVLRGKFIAESVQTKKKERKGKKLENSNKSLNGNFKPLGKPRNQNKHKSSRQEETR